MYMHCNETSMPFLVTGIGAKTYTKCNTHELQRFVKLFHGLLYNR
jgi:hypothetical protein